MTNAASQLTVPHAILAARLLPAVMAAARVQMHYFRSGTAVTAKSDASPVTAADQESEALLVAALTSVAPGIPIVAEEAVAAGVIPDLTGAAAREFFLVDPLDGTREFVADRPEFTITIALVRDGVPRFGLIYAPALSLFYVTVGDGEAIEAHLTPADNVTAMTDLNAVPIRSRAAPVDGLVALASRSHGSAGTDAFLGQYRIARRTSAGSSLKFCALAKGDADIYSRCGPTCEWDTAAGHAILAAAGGSVTTLDGRPLTYGKKGTRFLNPDFVAWGRTPLPPQF